MIKGHGRAYSTKMFLWILQFGFAGWHIICWKYPILSDKEFLCHWSKCLFPVNLYQVNILNIITHGIQQPTNSWIFNFLPNQARKGTFTVEIREMNKILDSCIGNLVVGFLDIIFSMLFSDGTSEGNKLETTWYENTWNIWFLRVLDLKILEQIVVRTSLP